MKKILVLLLLVHSVLFFSQVNIEEIKKNVTEDPKRYYYDYLEIFKTNPKTLTQDQLNYIYYGNNYVDYGYKRIEFNKELSSITKFTNRQISYKKISDLLEKANILYQKNCLNKDLLQYIYLLNSKIGKEKEAELYFAQYELLHETIKKSGTGKLDNSPIIVTNFSDKFYALEHYSGIYRKGISFETKVLPDGSWLDIFKNRMSLFFIKTVHHKNMFKDDN